MTSGPLAGPVLTCLADVEPREVEWLWPGRVPLGRITLLVGRPGEGKSFLTTDMAARVSTGAPWPDGTACPRGSVIIVSAEDDPADTIRPRLDAHGADARKVHLLSAVRWLDEQAKLRERMFTLGDLPALESALKQVPDCKLVVIDPIGSFIGGATDAHRDNEVRSVLAPVAKLAEKYGPAVLVVAHRRKSAGSIADDLALGSRAFTGIARAVWHVCRRGDAEADEQITGRRSRVRLLVPGKNNLAAEGDGLAFIIGGEPPRLIWSREPVAMTADEALVHESGAPGSRPGPQPEALKAAAQWLAKLLADGEVEAGRVRAETAAAGLAWRTVQRAADAMGVVRDKNAFGGGWQWRLPRPEDAKFAKNLASWRLRENQGKNGNFLCHGPEDDKFGELGAFGGNGQAQPAAASEAAIALAEVRQAWAQANAGVPDADDEFLALSLEAAARQYAGKRLAEFSAAELRRFLGDGFGVAPRADDGG
ncbi:AAA family ATPase [Fontivita pretiosa]|uniref:AAA family ATPase n=1 Tax=Fontivita pretiosa TaxID=2989684 RepID=UPI003D165F6D